MSAPDGLIVAGILCLIDENPRPNILFGAPAISIALLEQQVNVPLGSLSPSQVLGVIRPLAESLFPEPRVPKLKELKKETGREVWLVFDDPRGDGLGGGPSAQSPVQLPAAQTARPHGTPISSPLTSVSPISDTERGSDRTGSQQTYKPSHSPTRVAVSLLRNARLEESEPKAQRAADDDLHRPTRQERTPRQERSMNHTAADQLVTSRSYQQPPLVTSPTPSSRTLSGTQHREGAIRPLKLSGKGTPNSKSTSGPPPASAKLDHHQSAIPGLMSAAKSRRDGMVVSLDPRNLPLPQTPSRTPRTPRLAATLSLLDGQPVPEGRQREIKTPLVISTAHKEHTSRLDKTSTGRKTPSPMGDISHTETRTPTTQLPPAAELGRKPPPSITEVLGHLSPHRSPYSSAIPLTRSKSHNRPTKRREERRASFDERLSRTSAKDYPELRRFKARPSSPNLKPPDLSLPHLSAQRSKSSIAVVTPSLVQGSNTSSPPSLPPITLPQDPLPRGGKSAPRDKKRGLLGLFTRKTTVADTAPEVSAEQDDSPRFFVRGPDGRMIAEHESPGVRPASAPHRPSPESSAMSSTSRDAVPSNDPQASSITDLDAYEPYPTEGHSTNSRHGVEERLPQPDLRRPTAPSQSSAGARIGTQPGSARHDPAHHMSSPRDVATRHTDRDRTEPGTDAPQRSTHSTHKDRAPPERGRDKEGERAETPGHTDREHNTGSGRIHRQDHDRRTERGHKSEHTSSSSRSRDAEGRRRESPRDPERDRQEKKRRKEGDQTRRSDSRVREHGGAADEERERRRARREAEKRRMGNQLDLRRSRKREMAESPPPTAFLTRVFEDLPFAPTVSASGIVDWLSERWQVLAIEMAGVILVAYVVQAIGL